MEENSDQKSTQNGDIQEAGAFRRFLSQVCSMLNHF